MSTEGLDRSTRDNFQPEMEHSNEKANTRGPSLLHYWRNVLETTLISRKKESEEKNIHIPLAEFGNAWGIGVVSTFKGGVVVSAEVGDGLFFIKLPQHSRLRAHSKWIGPIFFSLYGSEIGFNIGATKEDNFFIFSDEQNVRDFLIKGQFQFGAATSAIGSNEYSRAVELNRPTDEVIKCYLLDSKGMFVGLSFEGCLLKIDYSKIEKFFGTELSADDFLSGRVQVPKNPDVEKIISLFEQYTLENFTASDSNKVMKNEINDKIHTDSSKIQETHQITSSAENQSKNGLDEISPQLEIKTKPAPIDEVQQKEIINTCLPTSPSSPSLPHDPHHERGPTLHGSGVQLQQWQINEAIKTKDDRKDLQQWQDNSATESKNLMAHQQRVNDVEIAKTSIEKTEDA